MKVYSESLGAGPDLVLLHGWGVHAGIFEDVAAKLAHHWRVTMIDLPGHGRSPMPDEPYNLDTLVRAVAEAAPDEAVWLGWSLGGMVALSLAIAEPALVSRLILAAASPQFVTDTDWPHAMDTEVLEEFAASLETDYHRTLERFLGLQVSGGDHAKQTLQTLKQKVFQHSQPHVAALRGGLDILRYVNLRPRVSEIQCPVLLVYGERDRLVPSGAGVYLSRQLPEARLEIFKGAGHAPFISHAEDFMRAVGAFLEDYE